MVLLPPLSLGKQLKVQALISIEYIAFNSLEGFFLFMFNQCTRHFTLLRSIQSGHLYQDYPSRSHVAKGAPVKASLLGSMARYTKLTRSYVPCFFPYWWTYVHTYVDKVLWNNKKTPQSFFFLLKKKTPQSMQWHIHPMHVLHYSFYICLLTPSHKRQANVKSKSSIKPLHLILHS